MKRRQFIKNSALMSLLIGVNPLESFAVEDLFCKHDALLGKGSPQLFGDGYKLLNEAHLSFTELKKAAEKEGLNIHVVSSYRDFDHQKRIWERKFKANQANGLSNEDNIRKITEYSTIPGTSRHHWGTDIDIVGTNYEGLKSILSAAHFEEGKPFYELGIWLEENASKFGFYRVYTDSPNRKGFKYEPWHYSYKPLSQKFLKDYIRLDLIQQVKNERFEGSNFLTDQLLANYKNEHILDINPELLP